MLYVYAILKAFAFIKISNLKQKIQDFKMNVPFFQKIRKIPSIIILKEGRKHLTQIFSYLS